MLLFSSAYNEYTVISKEYTGPLDFDITGVVLYLRFMHEKLVRKPVSNVFSIMIVISILLETKSPTYTFSQFGSYSEFSLRKSFNTFSITCDPHAHIW